MLCCSDETSHLCVHFDFYDSVFVHIELSCINRCILSDNCFFLFLKFSYRWVCKPNWCQWTIFETVYLVMFNLLTPISISWNAISMLQSNENAPIVNSNIPIGNVVDSWLHFNQNVCIHYLFGLNWITRSSSNQLPNKQSTDSRNYRTRLIRIVDIKLNINGIKSGNWLC